MERSGAICTLKSMDYEFLSALPLNNRAVIRHINRRIQRNANAFILVVGDVGSGKTYFCLDFALTLSVIYKCEFNADWVGFEPRDILRIVLKPHSRGQPILLDEMGIAMSSRKFMTKGNIGLSFLFQTCRFMNQIILFTVPDISFVDVVARKLFHYIVDVKPRFHNNKNSVSFRRVEKNKREPDKPFFLPIPYKDNEGSIKYVSYYTSTIPLEGLRKAYEEKRKAFITMVYQKQQELLEEEEKAVIKQESGGFIYKNCPICNIINRIRAGSEADCQYCGGAIQ